MTDADMVRSSTGRFGTFHSLTPNSGSLFSMLARHIPAFFNRRINHGDFDSSTQMWKSTSSLR